jgi:predicted GNAT superfamily acetyltransferase
VATGQSHGEKQIVTATAPGAEKIVVRNCKSIAEFRACVELQKEVWNFDDRDLVPLRMFVVGQKIGGQIIGAFDGDELVGFAFSIPAERGGRPFLHSHMLAVRSAWRNYGLGRRIKLAQREDALAKGFELMEWTFDPLEIKNAHLNLVRLGAIARRYSVNHYGDSSSPLQGGLPTDRLVAEWWLKSRRVAELLEGGRAPRFQVEKTIGVPEKIYAWKASATERAKAAEVQKRNREEFLRVFPQGLAALGYERDAAGSGAFLLGRWDENWSYGPVREEVR